MTKIQPRPAAALASFVLFACGAVAEARVISYAPITSRQATPAVQRRTNRHTLLVEQVSVAYPIPGPSCLSCFQTLSRLVVYDTQGLEEPRDVTPGGAPAMFLSVAAFEAENGPLFLYANGYSDPPTTIRNLFSRDGGTVWTEVAALPRVGIGSGTQIDVGGPLVSGRGAQVLPGSADAPFFVQAWTGSGSEIWAIGADGAGRLVAQSPSPLRLLGTNREGTLVLFAGQPSGSPLPSFGLWTADAGGRRTLVTSFLSDAVTDGWIAPDGSAYANVDWGYGSVGLGFTARRSVVRAFGGATGTFTEIATTSSTNATDLFAVPTAGFGGAWILQRGAGPTILSSHTPAGGLVEAWRDVTRPEVEALHAAPSGTRLLVQVHRPRPQVDQRIFKDPALAIWSVGTPAPASYDELFLQETTYKGFVHLDVDAAAAGAPFLFNSGSSYGFFAGPPAGGPSGAGGGGDVVQEWGVVRASLRQRLVIPAAARSNGINGSRWRTDLVLRNPDPEPVSVVVRFLPNIDAPPAAADQSVLIPASSVATYPDALASFFGLETGSGAILLVPEGTRSIEATSRTYTAAAGGGTYGMSVGAVDVFAALGANFAVSFSAGLLGDGFRTNLVATDVSGRGASADLSLAADSSAPGPLEGTIATSASRQRQVSDLGAALGAPGWRTASLLFTPRSGESIAGLMAIDNATNDPTWFPPDVPSLVPRSIPAVVHADGANGARYRTDLFLFNPSERTQSVTLAIKPWSVNTSERLLTLPLLPRESKTIRDVLSTAFGLSGVARLRFQTTGSLDDSGGVRVTSRTYTLAPSGGTYGLLLPALNAFQSAGGGESLEILLPAGGPGFRTNLALVDLSAAPGSGTVSVKVEVFDESGVRRDVFETPVPLAGGIQIDDLFHGRGLGDGPRAGVIRVSPAGGLVAAYASVIDNATNDPLYAPPMLAAKN
ncbi:MAG: hypothetical protein ABI584_13760 [Acidobacteriota bacterium]